MKIETISRRLGPRHGSAFRPTFFGLTDLERGRVLQFYPSHEAAEAAVREARAAAGTTSRFCVAAVTFGSIEPAVTYFAVA